MLTISKPLSSSQAQTYHAREFMPAEQNYWKQGDTILGEWQGRMAERYGLAGAIDEQHFARLSEGQNPLTGEQLVRHRNGQEYTTADGDKARTLIFDTSEMRHFDHGYAVTSHSSQGLTTDRVLVNMDTKAHPELINTRFAYVSVSRASEDAQIYTNDAATLAERLSTDISKASAVEVARPNSETQTHQPQPKEQSMTNTKELTPEEQRRQFQQEPHDPATDKAQSLSEIDQRHYTPIHTALPNEAVGYEWKRETGDIQSYQHNQTAGWLHIDPQGQFYDRHAQPIPKEHALEHAGDPTLAVNEVSQAQSIAKGTPGTRD